MEGDSKISKQIRKLVIIFILGLSFRGPFIQTVVADSWNNKANPSVCGVGVMFANKKLGISIVPFEYNKVLKSDSFGASITVRLTL